VDPGLPRSDDTRPLPAGATVIFFTGGLVERPGQPIDEGLAALAALASAHTHQPLEQLCQSLADQHPGDGHDDITILALRLPPAHPHQGGAR
jgi:serine phosphatase RsbU (regulator of sigma subunit)